MPVSHTYVNNSQQKDYIRSRWIKFAGETYHGKSHDFGIITFPAEAMQDLHLFKQEGFIDWEEVESESKGGGHNYKVTKGNIRCFEKKSSIFQVLTQKLIQAKVLHDDFCTYVNSNYQRIMGGGDKTFPVDVVNMDFEGRLYPNTTYPIDTTIKCIFEFQKKHKRDFSLFLTWPIVESDDIVEFKNLLKDIISTNLEDPSAVKFKESFEAEIGDVKNLSYERKSAIGVTKIILKKSSQNLFTLSKNEFYIYGGDDKRQRMISLLFNFKFDGKSGRENIIYSKDVVQSMIEIVDINELKK